MKKYITRTSNTCWKDCLACMLEVRPERVPDFVKEYKNKYMDITREWLKENFGMGLVYVPARCFMETGLVRYNGPVGPEGYSIGHLSMIDMRSMHVIICYNGMAYFDNGDDRSVEYGTIEGYFVLYNLEAPQAKLVKKMRKKTGK